MPPLKTFIFLSKDQMIRIEIKAYYPLAAMQALAKIGVDIMQFELEDYYK